MDLEVSIQHIHYADLAKAFQKVTGHKARFIDVDWDTYWREGSVSQIKNMSLGVHADLDDPATVTVQQNFHGLVEHLEGFGIQRGHYSEGLLTAG